MKIIEILKWEGSNKAIALCYAPSVEDLTFTVDDTTLDSGSLAYTAGGAVYVLGTDWNQIGG